MNNFLTLLLVGLLPAATLAGDGCDEPTCPLGNDQSTRSILEGWPEPNTITPGFLAQHGCDIQGCEASSTSAPTADTRGCRICGSADNTNNETCSDAEIADCFEGCGYDLFEDGAERSGFSRYLGNFATRQECREAWVDQVVYRTEPPDWNNAPLFNYTPAFIFGHGGEGDESARGECYAESMFRYSDCTHLREGGDALIIGDGNCDEVVNNPECGYDAGDCCAESCGETTGARNPTFLMCNASAYNCQSATDYFQPFVRTASYDLFHVNKDFAYNGTTEKCVDTATTTSTTTTSTLSLIHI